MKLRASGSQDTSPPGNSLPGKVGSSGNLGGVRKTLAAKINLLKGNISDKPVFLFLLLLTMLMFIQAQPRFTQQDEALWYYSGVHALLNQDNQLLFDASGWPEEIAAKALLARSVYSFSNVLLFGPFVLLNYPEKIPYEEYVFLVSVGISVTLAALLIWLYRRKLLLSWESLVLLGAFLAAMRPSSMSLFAPGSLMVLVVLYFLLKENLTKRDLYWCSASMVFIHPYFSLFFMACLAINLYFDKVKDIRLRHILAFLSHYRYIFIFQAALAIVSILLINLLNPGRDLLAHINSGGLFFTPGEVLYHLLHLPVLRGMAIGVILASALLLSGFDRALLRKIAVAGLLFILLFFIAADRQPGQYAMRLLFASPILFAAAFRRIHTWLAFSIKGEKDSRQAEKDMPGEDVEKLSGRISNFTLFLLLVLLVRGGLFIYHLTTAGFPDFRDFELVIMELLRK